MIGSKFVANNWFYYQDITKKLYKKHKYVVEAYKEGDIGLDV